MSIPSEFRTTNDSFSDATLDYDTSRMDLDTLRKYILLAIAEKHDDFLPRPFWFIFIDVIAQRSPGKHFGSKFSHYDDISQKKPGTEGFQAYAKEYIDFSYIMKFVQITEEILRECSEATELTPEIKLKAIFLRDAFNNMWWDTQTKRRFPTLFGQYMELAKMPIFQDIFIRLTI